MLDMLKETQRTAGARFSEMNLSSMLAAHARQNSREGPGLPPADLHRPGKSDSSLSPHSPADHDREEDMSREEEETHALRSSEGPHADSSGRDERHLSEEVRAQVFADLRRFSSRAAVAAAASAAEPATSTTTSPPLPAESERATAERARSLEDSLPPRKRKVSQEHHNLMSSEVAGFPNGHDHNSRDSSSSSSNKASPVKMMTSVANANPAAADPEETGDKKMIHDDEPAAPSLECRN